MIILAWLRNLLAVTSCWVLRIQSPLCSLAMVLEFLVLACDSQRISGEEAPSSLTHTGPDFQGNGVRGQSKCCSSCCGWRCDRNSLIQLLFRMGTADVLDCDQVPSALIPFELCPVKTDARPYFHCLIELIYPVNTPF